MRDIIVLDDIQRKALTDLSEIVGQCHAEGVAGLAAAAALIEVDTILECGYIPKDAEIYMCTFFVTQIPYLDADTTPQVQALIDAFGLTDVVQL